VALKAKKMVWENVDDPNNLEIYEVSIDDTDLKVNEQTHPTLNIDRKACSQKLNQTGGSMTSICLAKAV
jgi:hypothetical protein